MWQNPRNDSVVKDLLGLKKNRWDQHGALFPGIQAGSQLGIVSLGASFLLIFAINCEPLGSPLTA